MADGDREARLDRVADALGVSRDDLVRAALEQRFAAEAEARVAREHADALERREEWEGELDEGELWSEALVEETSDEDELDLWWLSGPEGSGS
jgi:hypothetical protein